MKHIRKGRKPAALRKFERENASSPQVVSYEALPAEVRRALAMQMLRDQGRLCAYTMRRIGGADDFAADCHFEHIRPQKRDPKLQLSYANIVLCAPGRDKPNCDWGAVRKGDALVDETNFLSPLRADCETRLNYRLDGSVTAASEDDAAATRTVALLNLNHRELISERLSALGAFGLGAKANKPLRGKAAEQLGRRIAHRNGEGDFEPFCIAIQQAAFREASRAERRAARLRSVR